MKGRDPDPRGSRATHLLLEANQRLFAEQVAQAQAEKLSSVGVLAAGVAHEINNPLSGLFACLKVLEQGQVAPERRREYVEAMRDGLVRIRETVRGLLDYSRLDGPAWCEVDLATVVQSAEQLLSPVSRSRQVSVDIDLREGEWVVTGDRSHLVQAVVNVLLNAVQASYVGGRISVWAEAVGEGTALYVADAGAGIEPALWHRVCEPYFTTKPEGEGTGLGLSVTSSILHAHGGRLGFDATPGGGATVTLSLPARRGRGADV